MVTENYSWEDTYNALPDKLLQITTRKYRILQILLI